MTEQEFGVLTLEPKREERETTDWGKVLSASKGLGKLSWYDYFIAVGSKVRENERGELKAWVEEQGKRGKMKVTFEGRVGLDYKDRSKWLIDSVTS